MIFFGTETGFGELVLPRKMSRCSLLRRSSALGSIVPSGSSKYNKLNMSAWRMSHLSRGERKGELRASPLESSATSRGSSSSALPPNTLSVDRDVYTSIGVEDGIEYTSREQEEFEAALGQRAAHLKKCRTLVLDVSYSPIDVITWQRAICLDLFDKVDVLEYYNTFVRSARDEHPVPAVVRVSKCVNHMYHRGRVPLNRKNLFQRDEHKCQYCGSMSELTIDHVVPLSKGKKGR